MNLRSYIEYRKAELKSEGERVSQAQSSGISAGAVIEYTKRAEVVNLLISELERLLKWVDAGEPGFVAPLTPEEKKFWKMAIARGMMIPDEIREQL